MRERVADNPEIRTTFRWLILLFLLFMTVAIAGSLLSAQALHRQTIERNIAVIGQLVTEHPGWKDDITAAFTRDASEQELAAGRDAAARLGLDRNFPFLLNKAFSSYAIRMAIGGACWSGLFLLSMLTIVYTNYRVMYRKIGVYTRIAERIVEGDFQTKPGQQVEGAFAKLAHQFNQMSNRLEQTLEKLQEEKESMKRLLSDISHQLKTPLAALKMFTELLLGGADRDAEVRTDFLNKSGVMIEKMEWLIRQLLAVARIEAGAVRLRYVTKPLVHTVEQAVRPHLAAAAAKRIRIRIQSDADHPAAVPHDPEWLSEAVGNIVKNGIEHAPEKGRLCIGIEETAVLVRITIEDNGPGIHAEDKPHIFERFYRGQRRSGDGSGIGLSLAKAVVDQHGGVISLKSAPGHGALFTITLLKYPDTADADSQLAKM